MVNSSDSKYSFINISYKNIHLYYADIDECAENSDNCTQNCTNTVGSFSCSCGSGFMLSTDSRTCQGMIRFKVLWRQIIVCNFLYTLDVDECLVGTDLCNQTCTNNVGSYTCGCQPGYRLNEDGLNCEGIRNEQYIKSLIQALIKFMGIS